MRLSLSKAIAVGISALVVATCVPMISEASNYTDSAFTFNVSATGGAGCVSDTGRNKEDDSSSYMYCTSYQKTYSQGTGSTYVATAYGSTCQVKGTFHNCNYRGNTAPSYSLSSGVKKYLTNYIYESGCRFATIYCSTNYTTYAKFSGLWSPDSI